MLSGYGNWGAHWAICVRKDGLGVPAAGPAQPWVILSPWDVVLILCRACRAIFSYILTGPQHTTMRTLKHVVNLCMPPLPCT